MTGEISIQDICGNIIPLDELDNEGKYILNIEGHFMRYSGVTKDNIEQILKSRNNTESHEMISNLTGEFF